MAKELETALPLVETIEAGEGDQGHIHGLTRGRGWAHFLMATNMLSGEVEVDEFEIGGVEKGRSGGRSAVRGVSSNGTKTCAKDSG